MNNKGMTLIELAVVLAIIAVLSAVLTPMVGNYIEQSRIARAQSDVRTIAEAVALYHRDTNRYPIYLSKADWSAADDVAAGGNGTGVIGGPGANPTETATWNLSSTLSGTTLDVFLNSNFSEVPINSGIGQVSFRAPYIGGVDEDPWGNKYLLTAGNLEKGSTNCAFVISAGPDSALDTAKSTTCSSTTTTAATALVAADDDILARIR